MITAVKYAFYAINLGQLFMIVELDVTYLKESIE